MGAPKNDLNATKDLITYVTRYYYANKNLAYRGFCYLITDEFQSIVPG